MKMLWKALPIAAAGILAATAGLAAVDNSHHDLKTWSSGTTQEVCLYCHGVTSTVSNAGYGAIGDLCVSRCHRGAGGYAASDDALPNRPASLTETGTMDGMDATLNAIGAENDTHGHGLDRMDLYDKYGANNPVAFDAIGEALPYTDPSTTAPVSMECTSCHNVHDYTNTPFLHRNLFTGGPGGNRSFCEACHATDRGANWAGGSITPNGDHPVNFGLVLGNSPRDAANDGERLGRYIAIDVASAAVAPRTTPNVFDVPTPNGGALSAASSNYLTGGKVSGFAAAGAGSTFGCYTCHSAHMDNTEVGITTRTNLVMNAAVSANGQWNPLCVSCHGNVANGLDDPNPGLRPGGATEWFYHPVGTGANAIIGALDGNDVATYLTSTGSFTFGVDLTAVLSVGNQGAMTDTVSGIEITTYRPRCTSCHDVHGGVNNSQALLELDGTRNGALTVNFCSNCHNGGGLPDVTDNPGQAGEQKYATGQGSHHRTRTTSYAGATINDADGQALTMDSPSWGANTASLDCDDCHVFVQDNHNNAHNW